MSFLDGFDDDFEVAARKPRPLHASIEELQRLVVANDGAGASAALARAKASAGPAPDAWGALSVEVATLAAALAGGRYVDAFTSDAARVLLRPVDDEEAEATKPHSLPSLTGLLRWRLLRYVVHAEGDAYADERGAADTPAAYRASAALFVAAASLSAYVQANYTGPELPAESLGAHHPLPYLRSLLRLPEWAPAAEQAWHRPTDDETRRRVEMVAAVAPTAAAAGEAAPASSDSAATGGDAAPPAAATEAPPSAAGVETRSPAITTSLAALAVGGDDAYDHLDTPHWLVTARALLGALLGPPDVSAATEAAQAHGALPMEPVPPAGTPAADDDYRFAKLTAAGRQLSTARWWAARAAVLHSRSLVERAPSALLWREAAAHFRAAARDFCPDYLPAFGTADTFLRDFVASEFAATAAVNVDRRALAAAATGDGGDDADAGGKGFLVDDGDDAGAKAAEVAAPPAGATAAAAAAKPAAALAAAAATTAAAPSARREPSPLVARLLLEWGNAQHFFGRAAGAKTAFFLARRETGLRTRLTGALGRRTKFQKFDVAQLVLHASSSGQQAADAVADAQRAEQLGAAPGRFSAKALRAAAEAVSADVTSPPAASAADATAAPSAAAAPAAASSAAAALAVEPAAAAAPEPVAVSADASAAPSDGAPPPPAPAPTVLGGVHAVALDEVDADNILLETPQLRPDHLQGVVTEEDAAREAEVFNRIGWGKALAERLNKAAADKAAAAEAAAGNGSAPAASPAPSTAVVDDVADGPLSALDQAVVLALCQDIKNSNPDDGLTAEEMRPYVERVLDTPLNWMVYSAGLLARSSLEFMSHRTQERAVLQLQALVDQHTNRLTPLQASQRVIDEAAPAGDRMAYIYALAFPPRWELKRQCADRYRSLGVLRSALQLYEELETWDDVIDCCVALDKRGRAEALIRARLAVRPTPRLWCVLGVVTDSDEPILAGWEASGGTYARAQLLLGKRLAARGAREDAVRALARGLALSPHAGSEWFALGMLLMQLDRLPPAAEAFTKCVQLDPSNANAWANLGSIALHRRLWGQGYAALEQALRLNRSDWRMAANFLVAALRTRNYSRAIGLMHRLLDERHKDERNSGVDVAALALLTQAVLGSVAAEARKEAEEAAAARSAAAGGGSGVDAAAAGAAAAGDDGDVLPALPDSLDVVEGDDDAAAKGGDGKPAAGGGGDDGASLTDAQGNPAAIYLEPLAKLLAHVTGAVSGEPRVWQLYARVHEARGRPEDALECRARVCRALQTAGWERTEAGVVSLCRASRDLVRALLAFGEPRHLLQARMHLATVVAKVEAGRLWGDHAEVAQLRTMLADVQAREAAAAAGGDGAAATTQAAPRRTGPAPSAGRSPLGQF